MIKISVVSPQLARTRDKFQRFSGRMSETVIEASVERLAKEGLIAVKSYAPVGRTGDLRNSLSLTQKGRFEWHITEGVHYGKYIREGTAANAPHWVTPGQYTQRLLGHPTRSVDPKKALWWPGLPHPIPLVTNHPGVQPNPYHERAADHLKDYLPQIERNIAYLIRVELT